MQVRDAEIDGLARHLVDGLIARGSIKAKAGLEALIACVVELMSGNFEEEARIDDEAERMAEAEARKNPGIDASRLRVLIRQRLAQRKGFTL